MLTDFTPDVVPDTIRAQARWLVWRWEERDGKRTKPPYQAAAPDALASSTDPTTWAPFTAACHTALAGHADGIGVALGAGIAGIDLDDCRDPASGHIAPWAQAIIDTFDSYSEVSPSKTGVKIFVRLDAAAARLAGRKHSRTDGGAVEMFSANKYFAVTTWHLPGTPRHLRERSAVYLQLHADLFPPAPTAQAWDAGDATANGTALEDDAVIRMASAAANGDKFSALWIGDTRAYGGDDSRADLGLCALLHFWVGNDPARIDRLFRRSGLMREKWDSPRGDSTYGRRTIQRAIAFGGDTYHDAVMPDADPEPADGPDPDPPPRTRFVRAVDVMTEPPPEEIVEGVAWRRNTTVLVADSGAGKTFVTLDLAAAISAGISWHGRDVHQGSVAYFSYEGDALGKRLRALRDRKGAPCHHVHLLRARDPLSPAIAKDGTETPSAGERAAATDLAGLVRELAARGEPPIRLLVVDTVRASLSGSEDKSENVSAYQRVVRRLMAGAGDPAGLLVHHAGWQDGDTKRRRERGSSAWRGNSDHTLFLDAGPYDRDRGEKPLTLETLKSRDGEFYPPLHLILRRVELAEAAGDDLRRGPVTSCIIEPDRATRETRDAERAARATAEARLLDLQTLRAILAHADLATSREAIRPLVGRAKQDVSASIDRLIRAGWIRPGRRGEPFIVTPAGHAVAAEAQT